MHVSFPDCDLVLKAFDSWNQSLLCRYGAEQGKGELRDALCQRFYSHVGRKPSEIFVSDGSKCDIGRLQMMFGADTTVAVQVDFSWTTFAWLFMHISGRSPA